jgi:hypothetical protein
VLDHLIPDAVAFHQDVLDQPEVVALVVVLNLHHFHPFYL